MEHQLWKEIVALLAKLDKRPPKASEAFSDRQIVQTYYWAVIHDRPVLWACQRAHWPLHERKSRKPSPATMSRRLRSQRVKRLLEALEAKVLRPQADPPLLWIIDGKPLVIGGCSKDRQAGYGRSAGGKAKGYKVHAIVGSDASVPAWRLAPMNKDERVMAKRMVRKAEISGYLLGDGNYDSNHLYQICDEKENLQFVCPRRYGSQRGHGHRKQTAGRMRAKELLENPHARFGRQLFKSRSDIERYYGRLSNWGGGLTHLPPWVRTYQRVQRWVQGKLILTAIKRQLQQRTYVAA